MSSCFSHLFLFLSFLFLSCSLKRQWTLLQPIFISKTQLRGSQWLYCECTFGSSVCCSKQRHYSKCTMFRPIDPMLLDSDNTPRFTVTGSQGVLQNSTLAVVASITKYTKTKYFLSTFVPMCRIMLNDKSFLCCSVKLKSIPVNSHFFTQEGFTYFLIHRTRFEFGWIVS